MPVSKKTQWRDSLQFALENKGVAKTTPILRGEIMAYYIQPSDYDIAEQNNINVNALNLRIRTLAWPMEKAVTTPVTQRGKWTKYLKIAEQNGIKSSTFYSRIRKGIEPNEAATTKTMSNSDLIKIINKKRRSHPQELMDLARKNGIPQANLCKRIRLGWDPNYAATTPVGKPGFRKSVEVNV